jgi:sigma-B regulation protein RsbU (phosphoserine phosphatase)
MDVGNSGRFVTLFYLAVQPNEGTIRWVRAGHDPGLIYRRVGDRFDELDGPGIALGVDPEWTFAVQKEEGLQPGDIVMLGTDGIWEARNRAGEMFGKQKVRNILRTQRDQPAEAILNTLFDAVAAHVSTTKLADDMTMVVAKILSEAGDAPGRS